MVTAKLQNPNIDTLRSDIQTEDELVTVVSEHDFVYIKRTLMIIKD